MATGRTATLETPSSNIARKNNTRSSLFLVFNQFCLNGKFCEILQGFYLKMKVGDEASTRCFGHFDVAEISTLIDASEGQGRTVIYREPRPGTTDAM